MTKQQEKTRKLVVTAMLAALASVLMFFEFPLTFIAPGFYELDFSEIPALIGSFSIGPLAGVTIEFIKILIKTVIKGTSTGGVGEIANFVIGISLILPASIVYKYKKNRKSALVGMSTGTISMVLCGTALNAFVLLPVYALVFKTPIEAYINMGTAINPNIDNLFTFCLLAVAPFNLIKGAIVSIVTFVLYKPLSRVIHGKM